MNTAAIDGHEPLPPILPAEASHDEQSPDDMLRARTTVTVQVFVHTADGKDLNARKSAQLPEENYPLDKALAHLAAQAAEEINPRLPRKESRLKD